jgi:TonB family protein
VLITPQGNADHIYVVQSGVPDLEQDAVKQVRKWKFESSRDSDGSAVAARTPIEVTFRFY